MYTLPVPGRDALADFDRIAASRRQPAKDVLQLARPNISEAYATYRACAGDGRALQPIAVANELKGYLQANFDLLDRRGSQHVIRDEILSSARYGRCVYCNYGPATSLDHALPRSVYSEFSVLAANLLPACERCNRKKGDTCYWRDEVTLPHLYFDTIPSTRILFVRVSVGPDTVGWDYYLQPDVSVDGDMFASIDNLFRVMELADLYRLVSVGDISERATHMDDQYGAGGITQLRDYLLREAESSRDRQGENYWKTAVLQALADDTDFCGGGFRHLLS